MSESDFKLKNEDLVFYAKTSEGWMIKITSDHLKSCIKTNGEFRFNKKGITIRQKSENGHILININFNRDCGGFNYGYIYPDSNETNLFYGINLSKLQSNFKNMNKKDSIEMYISKNNTNKMIFVIHSSNGSKETCNTNIFKIQNKIEKLPAVYDHPMVIPSTQFQKIIKKISSMDTIIKIRIQNSSYVSFFADDKSLNDSHKEFGIFDENESYYEESFYINDFKLISKMLAMSKNTMIYCPKQSLFPIKISINAGSLGQSEVYIKDVTYIKNEEMMKKEEAKKN